MKFSKNSKKQIYFIVIPLFFLISCGSKKQEAVNVETPIINLVKLSDVQTKNAGIIIAKMEQKEISSILKVNGIIDVPPQNMISVSVPMGGYLKSTNLLPGQHIKKATLLHLLKGNNIFSCNKTI